jgi:hypothetical protein
MRFFANQLQAGQTVNAEGFANGLQALADAVELMRGDGCYITWSALNIPTIHVDMSSSSSGVDTLFAALSTLASPTHVIGRKPVDPEDLTQGYTYGWVETVTHASQHPEAE